MAWSTPLLAVDDTDLTAAQWNASVRANLLETAPAKVTAAFQHVVSTGPNQVAARGIDATKVTGGSQATADTNFTDLTTIGPTVSNVLTGTRALVGLTAYVSASAGGSGGYMGYAVSGATTLGASVTKCLRYHIDVANRRSRLSALSFDYSLNAGLNTFQAKYATMVGGTTADFDERELDVIGL